MEAQAEPLKVLLVDDEAYFRVFVGKVLRKSISCAVTEAKNGQEAVAHCKAHSPDLIIMDISMPHMDGVQALTAIRAIKPDTPVIMLTSIAEEKVVEECVKQDASYFIRKDVGADKLQTELQDMLRMFVGGKEAP
jgi:CheY-like chemotaxis protein